MTIINRPLNTPAFSHAASPPRREQQAGPVFVRRQVEEQLAELLRRDEERAAALARIEAAAIGALAAVEALRERLDRDTR